MVIIAGPNGAGKSTLAPRLLKQTFGVYTFVNADMPKGWPRTARRRLRSRPDA